MSFKKCVPQRSIFKIRFADFTFLNESTHRLIFNSSVINIIFTFSLIDNNQYHINNKTIIHFTLMQGLAISLNRSSSSCKSTLQGFMSIIACPIISRYSKSFSVITLRLAWPYYSPSILSCCYPSYLPLKDTILYYFLSLRIVKFVFRLSILQFYIYQELFHYLNLRKRRLYSIYCFLYHIHIHL